MKNLPLSILIVFIFLFAFTNSSIQAQSTNAITKIKGDVYRYQHNAHYSVFMVTDDGIIVTDPISEEAATWLNGELKSRFNKPIKYLIYSHDHADHITGGAAFGDDVMVVGHRLTKKAIVENNRAAVVPDLTFQEKLTLSLGGKEIQLLYPGKSHSDNCIIMYFPEEKVVFVVDFITVNRLPYTTLNGNYMPEWVEAIKMVEELDFDIIAPGHAGLGTKEDVVRHREYIQELYRLVLEGVNAGRSLDQLKASIKLPQYQDFIQYENWLPLNIEGMHRIITNAED